MTETLTLFKQHVSYIYIRLCNKRDKIVYQHYTDTTQYNFLNMAAVTQVNENAEVMRSGQALMVNVMAAKGLQEVLKSNLGDLRVAGDDSRQWPYLLERGATDRSVALTVDGPRSEDGESRYALGLPVAPLGIDHLVLDADAPYFDRAFRLVGTDGDGEERPVNVGRLMRPIDDPRPVTIDVKSARLESLELIVEDGDDAPLVLRSVEARVRVPRLYLTAPEGEYDLYWAPRTRPTRSTSWSGCATSCWRCRPRRSTPGICGTTRTSAGARASVAEAPVNAHCCGPR